MRLSLLLRRLESSRADRACVRLAFLSWHNKTTPLRPASHGFTASKPQLQPDPSRLAEDEDEDDDVSDVEDGDSVVGGPMVTPPDGDVPIEGDGGSEAVLAGRLLLYARTFAEVSILTPQPRATQGIPRAPLPTHVPTLTRVISLGRLKMLNLVPCPVPLAVVSAVCSLCCTPSRLRSCCASCARACPR